MKKRNYYTGAKSGRRVNAARRMITVMLSFVMVFTMMPWLAPEKGQVDAASNPYPWWNDDAHTQRSCTSVAWQCVYDNQGVALPAWSDGVTWFNGAKNSGVATGSEPRVGAVAVWDGGVWNRWANRWYGHVAYVTSVQNANSFTVTEGGRSDKAGGLAYGYTMWNHPVGSIRPYTKNQTLLGFIYPKAPPVTKPDTPANVKISKTELGIGDAVSATWSAAARATSYKIDLVCTTNSGYSQSKTGSATSVSFAVNNPGTYQIRVTASNSAGSSGTASSSNTATVYKNVSVKYVDWDGKQIGATQSIKYGGNATAPASPKREGYTFQKWSSDGKNIKSDTTITAEYKINSYSVSFVDYEGNVIGSVQKINHGSAATPPTEIPAKEGYIFSEWSTEEYKNVTKALTVKAVYVWENVNLPIITNITSAKRNAESTGYDITVKLSNFPDNFTKGKLVAALKTKDGKMVASETKSISMPSTGETTETMTILYSGVASKVDVSMVGVIDDETTGTPKAKVATANVDIGNEWSDWSTTVPTGDDILKESRTEYRYKNRQIIKATTTPTTPSGYTLTSTANTGTYTAWGSWSGYSTTPRSSNTLQDVSTTTGYRFYAFRCANCGARDPYSGACSNCGGTNMVWVQDFFPFTGQGYSGGSTKMDSNKGKINYNGTIWYFEYPGTSDGQGGTGQPTQTLYRYRTRQEYKNYTYWSTNWSDWSPTSATASDSKQVETRTTYRFKNNGTEVPCYNYKRYKFENVNTGKTVYTYTSAYADSMDFPGEWEYNVTFTQLNKVNTATGDDVDLYGGTGEASWYRADVNDEGEVTVFETKSSLEDSLGTKRVQEGKIENAAGKVATLMVYKGNNEDPIASQIEYIGQTTIGDDGSYKFEYVTKEEPTVKTGDFVITLGIEGATNYIVLGKIDAPKATYAVNFVDDEGNAIGEQKTVVSGGSVEAPEAPEKEGYDFIGWDTALKNITENTVVTAQYKKKTCTVIFVDWNAQSLDIKDFEYGDTLTADSVPNREGKVFSKWLDENGDEAITVTNNMIVTADYVDAVYTVQFTDWDGNVISEKHVSYGEEVTAPKELDAPSDKQVFASWDAPSSLSYVRASMVVHPVAKYLEDAEAPVITVKSGTYADAQKVGIYSLNSDSKIYYSVKPIEEAVLLYDVDENDYEQYKSQFTISESSVVFAYAEEEGLNRSPIEISTIKIGEDDDTDVAAVVEAINAIPEINNIALTDEGNINYAKSLYDALAAEKQAKVDASLVEKMNSAIAKIAELKEEAANSEKVKADKAAADVVTAQINALPETITKADKEKIDAARTAYSNLTDDQRQYVTGETYIKLSNAEAAYQAILDKEAEEAQAAEASRKAIQNAKDKISALPSADKLTLSDEAAVQAAQAAYDALTTVEKEQIDSSLVSKLNTAVYRIEYLKQYDEDEINQAAANQAAADAVKDLIKDLPDPADVDWDRDNEQIESVLAEFDKLTPEQRDLVPYSSYSKLQAVAEALDAQDPRAAEEREKAENQQAVNNVTSLINDLPAVNSIKLTDKSQIEFARSKFNALTDAQMELITVADYRALENALTAAENRIAELEKEAEQTINPETKKDIADCDIKLAYTSTEYNFGSEIRPPVEAGKLTEDEDYTVEYKNNIEIGEGRVVVTGIGKYEGKVTLKFQINPINISGWPSLAAATYTYTGRAITPAINNFNFIKNDSIVTYANNVNIGTATVHFKGIKHFTGSCDLTYQIVPGKAAIKKLKKAKKSFTVTAKAQSGGVRYQVQYRLGKGAWKTKNTSKTKLTVKKLKSKKSYQVRIRAYKVVGGKTYYGAWSAVKKVKTK